MQVALYTRVSTARQAEKDLSIPDQLRQLKAYCKQNGHAIMAEYQENGASGTDDNRPQFQAMVSAIQKGDINVDAILVLTTSRFYRDAIGAGLWKRKLKKLGVRVVAITQEVGDPDTPTANLLETVFAAIDQHESQMIGFHTLRGMKENARQGFFNGSRPPYGYRVQKVKDERGNTKNVLAVNEQEADIVRRIFKLYTTEDLGAIEITKRLNEAGMLRRVSKKTGTPRKWTYQEVLRVLENTAYIGKHVFGRYDARNKVIRPESEWVVVDVPALVDDEVFVAAASLRKKRQKEWKNGRAYTGTLILVGLLKCGKCGALMISSTGKGGRYVYYTCGKYLREGKTSCSGHRVQVQIFEQQILEEVVGWAFSVENVKALVKKIRGALLQRRGPAKELRQQIEDIDQRLKRYYDAFEEGAMTPDEVGDRVRELKQQKAKLDEELATRTLVPELPASLTRPERIEEIQREFRQSLLSGSPQLKKNYLGILLEDIVLDGQKVTVRAKSEAILGFLEQKEKLSTDGVAPVLSSIHKWRPQRDLNPCRQIENLGS